MTFKHVPQAQLASKSECGSMLGIATYMYMYDVHHKSSTRLTLIDRDGPDTYSIHQISKNYTILNKMP